MTQENHMYYPIKLSAKTEIAPLLLVVAAWVLSLYFYAHFPAQVVTHWGIAGEPNGYMGKAGGAFAIPGLLSGIYLLFLGLPWLDPKRERYAEFGWIYNFFKTAIIFVLFATYLAASLYNLGYPVEIKLVVPTLVGLLLIIMGNFMGKIKRNWFIGVRTPWTLSNENVWTKTNRFGGFMMVLFGIIIIVSPLVPKSLAVVLFVAGAVLATAGTFVYSFIAYKNEKVETNINQS